MQTTTTAQKPAPGAVRNPPPDGVIDAFHLMWGHFPEPVTLVHKSREVVAVNRCIAEKGKLLPGMICAQTGNPEMHKGCRGNRALATGRAAYSFNTFGGKDIIGFWVPLDGCPDYFVHFGIGTLVDYKSQSTPPDSAL